MRKEEIISLLLRIGVAFAFIYPAVSAFFSPVSWIGFFPGFVFDLFSNEILLLHLFGITEIVIGVWILSGKKIFIPSVLATLYLALIIGFNLALIDVIFRDIPIMLMALALSVWSYKK